MLSDVFCLPASHPIIASSSAFHTLHSVQHPEKPGRPLTPYLRYVNANITTERVKNPGVKHPELLKIIRQNWHNLTSQEKVICVGIGFTACVRTLL